MLTIGNPVARRRIQRRAPRIACAITSGWREGISPRQLRPMSPEEYLERAEHFRKAAAEASVSSFTRWHLETMERSYRTSGRERGRASSVRPRGRGASKSGKRSKAASVGSLFHSNMPVVAEVLALAIFASPGGGRIAARLGAWLLHRIDA